MEARFHAAIVARCGNTICRVSPNNGNFAMCGGCKHKVQLRYCSKQCQVDHWRYHKFLCKHARTEGNSSRYLQSWEYYQKVAGQHPDVLALAKWIKLDLPNPEVQLQLRDIKKPIHRLIITGHNTPSNMTLFFGEHNTTDEAVFFCGCVTTFAPKQVKEVRDCYKQTRIEVFLRPALGSGVITPIFVSAWMTGLFDNIKHKKWKHRSASAIEVQELQDIKEIRDIIRQYMRTHCKTSIDASDMRIMFMEQLHPSHQIWRLFIHAYNSMSWFLPIGWASDIIWEIPQSELQDNL